MTTDIARKMLDDVLDKCFDGGIYVPVTSFDGQWFRLAVRSASGNPLTLLQLMKDVFQKAKATKKADIIRVVKETNVVVAMSQADVMSGCELDVSIAENGQIQGPINMFNVRTSSTQHHPFSIRLGEVV